MIKLFQDKITYEIAEVLALCEFEKYKVTKDKDYISDFDREVKKIAKINKN